MPNTLIHAENAPFSPEDLGGRMPWPLVRGNTDAQCIHLGTHLSPSEHYPEDFSGRKSAAIGRTNAQILPFENGSQLADP